MKIHKLKHHSFLTRDHLYEADEWFKGTSNLKIGDQVHQGMSWPKAGQQKCRKKRMYVGSRK